MRVARRREGARGGRRPVLRRPRERVSPSRLRTVGGGGEPGPWSRREGLRAGGEAWPRGDASTGRVGGRPSDDCGGGARGAVGLLRSLGGARPARSSQRWRGHVGALCPRLRLPGAGYSHRHPASGFEGSPLPGVPAARFWSGHCVVLLSAALPRWEPRKLCYRPSVGSPGAPPGEGRAPTRGGWACVCVSGRWASPLASAGLEGSRERERGLLSESRLGASRPCANPWGPEADSRHVRLGVPGPQLPPEF